MPDLAIETWTRDPASRALIGYRLEIPENVVVERPPGADARLRAVERRAATGRTIGEIDVAVFRPNLIMDRDGVLCETVTASAHAFLSAPRSGYAHTPVDVVTSAGPAWRIDLVLESDEHGGKPALSYATLLAIGHPDLRVAAALFVTIRSASETWAAGEAILESLRFAGKVGPASQRADGMTLAF